MKNLHSGGSRKQLYARKKCAMKIKRNKQRNEEKKSDGRFNKRLHFIVGGIYSILIEMSFVVNATN